MISIRLTDLEEANRTRVLRFIFGSAVRARAKMAAVASHPEECPKCGKLTRHWFYAGNTMYVECEHCGYSGTKSKYAVRM